MESAGCVMPEGGKQSNIGNVNLYIRQAKFDTQIPEFDTQIPKFDTQNFKIRHPNSRIRHLNSTGVEISSVVEYIDLRSHYELSTIGNFVSLRHIMIFFPLDRSYLQVVIFEHKAGCY